MSAAGATPGSKRHKMRHDTSEFFQEEARFARDAAPHDVTSYRFYSAAERLHGRSMEEWLRPAVSLTAFRNDGSDMIGRATFNRPWDDGSDSVENCKRWVRACFELCGKLGLKYWSAFDSDFAPRADSGEECEANRQEMSDFVAENMLKAQLKPLWIAPDLHSHARYSSGAGTSNKASTYMHAAASVKRSLDLALKLNSECFLIWPAREGASDLVSRDPEREMRHLAKLLQMAAQYRSRSGYRGLLLLMPHRAEPHQDAAGGGGGYLWDSASCVSFLKQYGLDRTYKICVPPGYQVNLANYYSQLGGLAVREDCGERSSASAWTLAMKSILDKGCVLAGGATLSVVPRRHCVDARDLLVAYVRRLDTLARALRAAERLRTDQQLAKHTQELYSSFYGASGIRLTASDVTLEECEDNARNMLHQPGSESGTSSRSEHWQTALQRCWDAPFHN